MEERNELHEWLNAKPSRSFCKVSTKGGAHLSRGNDETLCGRLMFSDKGARYISSVDASELNICASCWKIMQKEMGEIMAAKNAQAETVEIDESLADALGDSVEAADPNLVTCDQVVSNIERARSLAEAENTEGLAELAKETEDLISSLPSRGKVPGDLDGQSWTQLKKKFRDGFREAAQAQPKPEPEPSKAVAKRAPKAEAVLPDYSKFEGVAERVDAAVGIMHDGAKLTVKVAQTARQAAEMFLDGQRRIIRPDGLPDLTTTTPEALQARKDMITTTKAKLADEGGDAEHAAKLVDKFWTSVKNQMSDVRIQMVRALDDSPEEFAEHFAKIAELKPELAELKPSEQVFKFYDIATKSKRELMAERNAEKAAKLKELEAKASEGDETAAEAVEELKTETVAQRVATKFQAGDKQIREALKAAKELSDDDKQALKAKIMELVALASEL
ncbi:hypothetical protein AB0958_21875 [Streptomyces sp. NPDC006655]|uniref:hypothetical protein n=1 Tax=Streptomyces sp. NPDC006655 TaxID=3156898 RepID=UPI0034572D0B